MGGCRCTFRKCTSATKTHQDYHFFHYPVKQRERCVEWIRQAQKPHFLTLSNEQLRNKVVCEMHFNMNQFTNALKNRLIRSAIPNEPGPDVMQTENLKVVPASSDGTIFTLDPDSLHSNDTYIPTYQIEDDSLILLKEEHIIEIHDEPQYVITSKEHITKQNKPDKERKVFRSKNVQTIDPLHVVDTDSSNNSNRKERSVFNNNSSVKKSDGSPKKSRISVIENISLNNNTDQKPCSKEVNEVSVNNTLENRNRIHVKDEEFIVFQIEDQPPKTKNTTVKKCLKPKRKALPLWQLVYQHGEEIKKLKQAQFSRRAQFSRKAQLNHNYKRAPQSYKTLLNVFSKKHLTDCTGKELEVLQVLKDNGIYNVLKEKLRWPLPPLDDQ